MVVGERKSLYQSSIILKKKYAIKKNKLQASAGFN